MIFGCGIDIEEISRFKKHLKDNTIYDSTFIKQIYTDKEVLNYLDINKPELLFPLSFSCKESCFKALGVSWTNSPIGWKDIEVFFNPNFEKETDCTIHFGGHALKLFREKNFNIIESTYQITSDHVVFKTIIY